MRGTFLVNRRLNNFRGVNISGPLTKFHIGDEIPKCQEIMSRERD